MHVGTANPNARLLRRDEEAGQLEDELSRNGWLTVQADPEIIFSVPPEERFAAAIRLLGIDISMLSGDAGHA